MLSDAVGREIRTWVPIWVGVGLTFLARTLGIVIDEQTSAAVILLAVSVVQGAYHLLAAWLEHLNPFFGWLLGVPKSLARG